MFAPELPGLDREQIRDWYNGYSWLGEAKKFTIPTTSCCFSAGASFAPIGSRRAGTPAFLVETLFKRRVGAPDLVDGMVGSDELLSTFDVDDIATEGLLFQTGYLTIKDVEDVDGKPLYRLDYPNREVRQSLNENLLRAMAPDASRQLAEGARLHRLLGANDFPGIEELFRAFFAGIPYEWHTRNNIADYEGYYASVFYGPTSQPWAWM